MNTIKTVEYYGKKIRYTIIDDIIWFLCKDVCLAIELRWNSKATIRKTGIEGNELRKIPIYDKNNHRQQMMAIPITGVVKFIKIKNTKYANGLFQVLINQTGADPNVELPQIEYIEKPKSSDSQAIVKEESNELARLPTNQQISTLMPSKEKEESEKVYDIHTFDFISYTIRAVIINNEPALIAQDICEVLELKGDPSQHLRSLEEYHFGLISIQTNAGIRKVLVVFISGFYALIGKSRKPVG
jgi:prophage antirepressor-like protein